MACAISFSAGRAAILDLDPNANILAWAERRRARRLDVPFSVHGRPAQADQTVELIGKLVAEAEYLLIELEGSKDQIITFALARTDLCIIPLDDSPMEARQAAATVKLVQTTASVIRAPIRYMLLFTRTNAAFQTSGERDVRREMKINDIPTLPVRVARRVPYPRIFRDEVLLAELPGLMEVENEGRTKSAAEKAARQVSGAIENARKYAQAVIRTLKAEAML